MGGELVNSWKVVRERYVAVEMTFGGGEVWRAVKGPGQGLSVP